MILGTIYWDVEPEIFRVGDFAIRWYGLFFAMSFYFGYLIMTKFFKKEEIPVKLVDNLTIYVVIGTILGARLGHCFFYEPSYYFNHPIEIIKIWKGGLASHGAAVGILVTLYAFARKYKKPYLWILDRIVITVALAGFFIRMGNLMNSEIFGIRTNLPWGFIFASYDNVPRHPTQIYEALSYLLIFVFLTRYYYKTDGKPNHGVIFGFFLVSLFSVRFLLEFLKLNQVSFEEGMPLNLGQLLSIPFILLGLGFLLAKRKVPNQYLGGHNKKKDNN